MASYIWLKTILIVRKETRCRHIGYSYRLAARVLLYAPSHRQDNTYHGLCYTSRGALAGTRNSSMGPPHEGSIRRPIAPGLDRVHKLQKPRAADSFPRPIVAGFERYKDREAAVRRAAPRTLVGTGGIAPNHMIARSEFEVHRQINKE